MADQMAASMPHREADIALDAPPEHAAYCQLVPLEVQAEGDSFLVGSLALNQFFQVPDIGLQIIRMLQNGLSIADVKAKLAVDAEMDAEEGVDVDDFVDTLVGLQIARRVTTPPPASAAPARPQRWLRWATPLARALFSWPGALVYLGILACGIAAIVANPSILPQRNVFFFSENRTFSFLALLALYSPIVMLHELGHILAAARRGLASRLGIGTRLWTIVVEADLTALLSLPRSQRYVPLLAGLAVDMASVSLLLMGLAAMLRGHVNPYLIHLVQALTMQTLLIMLWQTNIFLRTDLYFVLCTWLSFPDLDRDARRYLGVLFERPRSLAGAVSPRALGDRLRRAATTSGSARHLRTVQLFAVLWVAGRVLSIYVLLTLLLPTLAAYAVDNYHALRSATPHSIPYDSLCFTLAACTITFVGLAAWLSQNRQRTQQA